MPHEVEQKLCRLGLYLTQTQRASYEAAAATHGQTLSQWSIAILDDASSRDIEQMRQAKLSDEAFERFCEILSEPMPKSTFDLLAQEEIWQ